MIADYGIIGDCHSLALVGRDGSIDWACFPRFDARAAFCRILDEDIGGHFAVTPERVQAVHRAYVPDTNVLVTEFECASGSVELTDCMPARGGSEGTHHVDTRHAVLRRVRCTQGSARVRVELAPRFEFATLIPRFRVTSPTTAEIVGGADALWVRSTMPLEATPAAITAEIALDAGEEAWIEAAWTPSYDPAPPSRPFAELLDETVRFWRTWMTRCTYTGLHEDAVRRSALTLKALTYAPSGAVIAAGTTSLPEEIGGSRNWDYRYTWIRDATLTLISLFILGFRDEADAFKCWLERTGAGRPDSLQIMYGICGERLLPEFELPHLKGHRGSAPVRIGNGAVSQMQLDCYGQILQAAYLYARAERALSDSNWRFLAGLADLVCERWRTPDHGIWEMRDEPRHFVHSKLNCWMALDRAVRMADAAALPGDVDTWRQERDALHAYLHEHAAPEGWLHQAVGVAAADASVLLAPAIGFIPAGSDLGRGTVAAIRRHLEHDGLVHRYLNADGLAGGEGAFLLCSFWLLDCLTHAGELDEAEALLDRLVGLANDLGLFAEEVDPTTGEQLGNFPQAFTHMALVTSASHLSAAREGRVDFGASHDFAELALDRLLSAR